MKRHALTIYVLLCFLILLAGLFLVAYWLIFPLKVIEVKTPQPLAVQEKQIQAGDTIHYNLDFCKYTTAPTYTIRQLVDHDMFFYGLQIVSNLPPGCRSSVSSFLIPKDVPPGTYHIVVTALYKLNPLRTYTLSYQTQEFTVSP